MGHDAFEFPRGAGLPTLGDMYLMWMLMLLMLMLLMLMSFFGRGLTFCVQYLCATAL